MLHVEVYSFEGCVWGSVLVSAVCVFLFALGTVKDPVEVSACMVSSV